MAAPGASKKRPPLEPRYVHWLDDEVNYLITHEEEQAFLTLSGDDQRDRFMERFWQLRNPDSGSLSNSARDENYRRIQYAQDHFGQFNLGDGIHTDRGMVYITLGPPQQREVHPESPHLRPIEIWFYQNTSGGLPTHFYVVFFRRSRSEDFKLYSPYVDRPERLVDGTDAVNNDKAAIHFIDNALGVEAAHVVLSLIPGEPVDTNNPQPSLQSDVLLSHIRDFRNLPTTKEALEIHRSVLEGVSHRLLLGSEFSDLTLVATRDGAGGGSLHYLFSLRSPQDFGFGQKADGELFYSLHLHTELRDAAGKVVSHGEQDLGGDLAGKQGKLLSEKAFSLEGRMPVRPGKYELRLELTNKVTRQAFQASRTILVPDADQKLGISQVFFANTMPAVEDGSRQQPFSFSGVKLSPRGGEGAILPEGSPVRVVFQLWEGPADPAMLQGGAIEIHYLIGSLTSKDKHEEDQTVDRAQFDPAGNLLMGKDFSTEAMSPGSYRLVIKVTKPSTGETVYQTRNFTLADPGSAPPLRWTLLASPVETRQPEQASAR